MAFVCERCREQIRSQVYRVTSEEGGEVLLDMVVCRDCYLEAKELKLHTERIRIQAVGHRSGLLRGHRLVEWLGKTLRTTGLF